MDVVDGAKSSHGRSHRFDPCHAHFAFLQANLSQAKLSSVVGVPLPGPDSSYTLPTVAQTEPSSTTSPTIADVRVPKLVGMRARTAKNALADRQLHWRITYKTTSRYPSGTVISQSRQAGTDVRPGSTITLIIAKAPPVTAPPTTEPAATPESNCDPAYPNDCIPPPPPDLDCADIGHRVEVDHRYGDPHRLDADGDGIGCDGWG
jgi:PASTA domain